MNKPVRISAKGLLIRDGKMAAVRLRDADGEFYIMPGGGLEDGELLTEALKREIAEETGMNVSCGEMLFVIEGLEGESFHRVDMIFACEYIGRAENAVYHGDTNQTGIGWLDIETLNTAPLYPSKLRRQIMNYYEGKPHAVYLGCENVGDSEVAD